MIVFVHDLKKKLVVKRSDLHLGIRAQSTRLSGARIIVYTCKYVKKMIKNLLWQLNIYLDIIRTVKRANLELAYQKTEGVLGTGRKIPGDHDYSGWQREDNI